MLSAYIEEDMYNMEQFIRVRNMKKKPTLLGNTQSILHKINLY